MKQFQHFIDGDYRESASGRTFDNIAPATGQLIGAVHEAGQEEVDAAVAAARDALHGEWGGLSPERRCDLLYSVADGINNRFNEFLEAE